MATGNRAQRHDGMALVSGGLAAPSQHRRAALPDGRGYSTVSSTRGSGRIFQSTRRRGRSEQQSAKGSMTCEIPGFLQDLLATPPRAGEGVHVWLFRVARQLHAHMPAGEIVSLLERRVATCGRPVSRNEILDAVRNSWASAWQPPGGSPNIRRAAVSRWPEKSLEHIEAVCAEGYGLADLWEHSNPRLGDAEQRTEEIINRLFPGNPLLCCGKSQSQFDTRPREDWRGELAKLQFIVPSPMTTRTGLTQQGKASAHTLNNTGPRRFLVVECDFSIFARDGKTETKLAPLIRKLTAQGFEVADMCAAVLLHLAQFAPMVCAVHSGGKSVHGWFFVAGQPEEKVAKFFRYAVSIGGDSTGWTRSQFMRMPDGTRDNGERQTVYFLNFKSMEATK